MTTEPSIEPPREDLVLGYPCALYEHAVLHILVGGAANQWRLLFAFIELLPLEVPPPLHDGFREGPRLKKRNCRIFADHVPLSVTQALAWYEDARGGRVVRPEGDGSVSRADDPKATICLPLGWGEEPLWPSYVLADTEHRLPFLSRWHATPRVHHLMPTATTWDFSPEESAILDEFMEREVGFRRSGWMQLAESVHLIVPNPYYRAFKEALVSAPPPRVESIRLAVEPRNRVVPPALEVDLVEYRPTGRAVSVTVPLDAQPRTVAIGPAMHETSAIIRLASGGLLQTRAQGSLMRELQFTTEVSYGKRIVSVVDPQGQQLETYEVAVAHPNTTEAGRVEAMGAVGTLTTLMNEVSVRDAAKQLEQRWFAGNPDVARDFVRSLIRPARDQVLIADPFLGLVEIQRCALAVALAGVPVRLLTTRDGFGKNSFSAPVLERNIARWRANESSLGQIELRVMERDELHDRFLRVDGRLYTLGNSLNSLGDKGSLVMRIPDPAPVFDELEKLWRSPKTKTLADIVAT